MISRVYSLTRRENIFFTTLQNECLEYEVLYIGDQFVIFVLARLQFHISFFFKLDHKFAEVISFSN